MAFWHVLPTLFWRGVSIDITISDLELCTIRSTANLANWENLKSHGAKLWKKEVLKIIVALCFYTYRKKRKEKLGLDLGRASYVNYRDEALRLSLLRMYFNLV